MYSPNAFSEQIEQARQASLADYFQQNGYDVERSRNELHIKGYGGLFVNTDTNEWYCFSQPDKRGGKNAINCLTEIIGLDFKTAVEQLTGTSFQTHEYKPKPTVPQEYPREKKELLLPEHADNCKRVLAYLCQTRHIDSRFVNQLIADGLLYQDKRGNAVFLHKDENGKFVGAEIQGTSTYQRYKGVASGTHDSLFSLEIGKPTKAYIFESAIDLLSFRQLANPQKIQNSVLVSMAGLKPNSLKSLQERGLKLYACVDADEAGRKFISDNNLTVCNNVLTERGVKDFNELLQQIMKNREQTKKPTTTHRR